jgi:hypothetical protein
MVKTAVFAAILTAFVVQANAAVITDPVGDYIPSFTGAKTVDRDVVAASASYANGNFDFGGTFAGSVGSTAGTVYVFGINRGAGTARFGAIATGVLFDSVVIVTPNVSTVVRDFVANSVTPLAASATTINGNSIDVMVAGALLPSTGFSVAQYTVNLWPRSGLSDNSQIADFAPDNSNFGVSVPEPASLALLGVGMVGLITTRRRTV